MTAPKVSDILRRAGDVSRERGWCRGRFVDPEGRMCSSGAYRCAATGNPEGKYPEEASELFDTVVNNSDGIFSWNDAPGRTHAEVLIALDAAYVLALQEEGVDPADLAERGEL